MSDVLSDLSLKKLPPHQKEAEQCVLGACLKSNQAFARSLEILSPDDFYSSTHQRIYSAMADMFEVNETVDVLTLTDRLQKKDSLEACGGMEYLLELEEKVPTAEAVSHHSKIVREKKVLRDLIATATEIVTQSYEAFEDVETILDQAEQAIFEISEKRTRRSYFPINEIVKKSFQYIEELFEKPGMITGVETGFTDLDHMTSGFQPSDLIILAARPSMGKTSFALDIARFAAMQRKVATAVFSLEMAKEQLALRMLCAEAKVNSTKLRTGYLSKEDWPRLTTAAGRISEAPIFIDDSPALTALDVRARTRRLKAEHDIGLVIIDYLQLMHARGKTESRQLEISEISRSLKALAKEINVPVMALSQLSRGVESRTDKRPLLSDLRESGAIEQDADVVAFIYRDEVYNPETAEPGVAELLIRKQRNGPIGDVKLTFIHEFTRFTNHSDEALPGGVPNEAPSGDVPF